MWNEWEKSKWVQGLVGKPSGKRPFGRPRHRQVDTNINLK
jgi:hypothetical protein